MKTCKKRHQYDEGLKRCPECRKEYDKQWYVENSEHIKQHNKQYREKNPEKVNQYYKKNPEKAKQKSRQYREKNPEKVKQSKLLYIYNIDLKTYNSKMEEQNFSCKICKEPAKLHKSGKYYILDVDHDHNCCPGENSCGKCIRGLICHNCNMALGAVKDNLEILYKAVEYLKSYQKPQEKASEPTVQADENKTLEPIVSS